MKKFKTMLVDLVSYTIPWQIMNTVLECRETKRFVINKFNMVINAHIVTLR